MNDELHMLLFGAWTGGFIGLGIGFLMGFYLT